VCLADGWQEERTISGLTPASGFACIPTMKRIAVLIGLIAALPLFAQSYVKTPYGRVPATEFLTTQEFIREVGLMQRAQRTEAEIAAKERAAEAAQKAAAAAVARAKWRASPEGQAAAEAKVERLESAVVKFQREQALAGSARCQFELGVRHLTGNGVEKDEAAARKLLAQAAAQDHEEARAKLAELAKAPVVVTGDK
jgi:hypothetical protein